MSHSSIATAPDARRARGAGLLLAALASSLLVGCAEILPRPDSPAVTPPASISAADNQEAALAGARLPAAKRVLDALIGEAKRYVFDAAAFVRAPAAWDASDWRLAAGAGASLGTLLIADESIDSFARRQRSRFTDRVSGATTWFGGGGGFDIPFVLLAAGLALSDANARDMGRDSLEACLFAGLLTKGVKRVAGRERPFETDGETSFKPLTSHDSFPSAHTTQAFAIASVVAMRSEGWVVPALAYTVASVVAFDRVNDRVHFASDVAAGALVGTVVGRFLVARHRREDAGRSRVDFEILPLRSGLAARLRF